MFEDEASFWIDGTLHRTWARVGCQPRVDTYGQRKTAHIFGAISLENARFKFQFAEAFNGQTFLEFLKHLVWRSGGRKIFLIIDNSPAHQLDGGGLEWLHANTHRIELHRLPPYSPEFNPMEPIWKVTRKMTTHNRFYPSASERDAALVRTFRRFMRQPSLIRAHLERFSSMN
jgi:transposase